MLDFAGETRFSHGAMQPQSGPPDITHRFLRTHPPWFRMVRRPAFLAVTLGVVAAFALFVLPRPGAAGPAWVYSTIALFLLLVLAWSGNVLADKDKPETLKLAVSLALIAVMAWLFYRYSGAQWDKLTEFYFNFSKLEGNWWILRDGLGVTLMLAAISAAGSSPSPTKTDPCGLSSTARCSTTWNCGPTWSHGATASAPIRIPR